MKYFKQYFYCSIIFLVISHLSFSQRWDSVGTKFQNPNAVNVMYADSVDNYLYVAGDFDGIGNSRIKGIARWNGTTWDSLGAGIDGLDTVNKYPNNTFAIARYQGKLYVGGVFNSLGNANAPCLGTWDGSKWDSVAIRPFKNNLNYNGVGTEAVINNKLYIGGDFDSIAGKPCIGIAQWNGSNWANLNFPNLAYFFQISTICEYNGSIYVGGLFCNTLNDTNSNVLRWDGTSWHSVGGGIKGSAVSIFSMVVYKGELYVAGYFFKSDGNAGNYIMRWNGTTWNDVDGGTGGSGNAQIENAMIYNNKLYVMGVFDSAGGLAANRIASWDGAQWCSLGSTFDNTIGAACVYKDSLYIGGGFWTINGDSISYLAEWTGGNYTAECSTLSVPEVANAKPDVMVYPNPNNGVFTIELSVASGKSSVEIYNMLGEKVYTASLNPSEGGTSVTTVSIPNGVAGVYLYRIISETGQLIGEGKLIVQ